MCLDQGGLKDADGKPVVIHADFNLENACGKQLLLKCLEDGSNYKVFESKLYKAEDKHIVSNILTTCVERFGPQPAEDDTVVLVDAPHVRKDFDEDDWEQPRWKAKEGRRKLFLLEFQEAAMDFKVLRGPSSDDPEYLSFDEMSEEASTALKQNVKNPRTELEPRLVNGKQPREPEVGDTNHWTLASSNFTSGLTFRLVGKVLRKDKDERNKEAKELNAALLQRQEAIESKHLQHQVQLTDKHVAVQQQLSEASNKTIDTVKPALNEQQQKVIQDLKDQMAIERKAMHRHSKKYTQEIAMQLISDEEDAEDEEDAALLNISEEEEEEEEGVEDEAVAATAPFF
ncbi:hypothetical protein CYMTET_15976 [Cymbomonas tetramitiformis]|uniref:Uncharacterized protein n=1 Tax=Cymbomonas tetramitiformis TaxID=36881 RepID=A0AAE0GDG9_9CHLO|nr:hypothetical protein CYMTET_15976 [Cymbomonas tetramitiformis]